MGGERREERMGGEEAVGGESQILPRGKDNRHLPSLSLSSQLRETRVISFEDSSLVKQR